MEDKEKNTLEVVSIRLVKNEPLYSAKPIRTPQDAVNVIAKELSSYDREVFCVLNMKANGNVINMNLVSVGSLNECIISPREFFKSAVLANACRVIAIHNHVSGNTTPSREDIMMTKKLDELGRLTGIPLVDHIIVAGGNPENIYSFEAHDLIHSTTGALIKEPKQILTGKQKR